jgi:hypothetical protein
MPMNVASIAHGAITLNYKQAALESLEIKTHCGKKNIFQFGLKYLHKCLNELGTILQS